MKKDDILIIIDAQNDFIDGVLKNEAAIEAIPKILTQIPQFNTVLLTQDTHDDNYLDTFEGKNLPIKHCIKNTYGWQINKDILDTLKKNNIYYEFCEKNTFCDINLFNRINKLQEYPTFFEADTIYICGFCTDICVISNALYLRTWFPDKEIVILQNCCAGVTKESHEAALTVMKNCQITIV